MMALQLHVFAALLYSYF